VRRVRPVLLVQQVRLDLRVRQVPPAVKVLPVQQVQQVRQAPPAPQATRQQCRARQVPPDQQVPPALQGRRVPPGCKAPPDPPAPLEPTPRFPVRPGQLDRLELEDRPTGENGTKRQRTPKVTSFPLTVRFGFLQAHLH
jgi:hypothetical protein